MTYNEIIELTMAKRDNIPLQMWKNKLKCWVDLNILSVEHLLAMLIDHERGDCKIRIKPDPEAELATLREAIEYLRHNSKPGVFGTTIVGSDAWEEFERRIGDM